MTYIAKLEKRIAALEILVKGAIEYTAKVTNVEDPEGRNRIRVESADIWGDGFESDWVENRTPRSGPGYGDVHTPRLGDMVAVRLRQGNPEAAEWAGGHRGEDSPIPEEFTDPDHNGYKTPSGITFIENDKEDDEEYGSYTIQAGNESTSKIVIHGDGTIHVYGDKKYVHCPLDMNADESQHGVITTSVRSMCPLGWLHRGSENVKASD